MLEGEVAFKLYDTYGFPLDLTQDALRARGLSVNLDGYEAAMARQRALARENWQGSGDKGGGAAWLALKDRLGPTRFVGYESIEAEASVLALVRNGQEVDEAEAGDEVDILVDATPLYAESGGQASDKGHVRFSGGEAELLGLSKEGGGDLYVHRLKLTRGVLSKDSRITLLVDDENRTRTRANHSAAHLAHAALKRVLGPHVAQKGQMVDAERMRFDFSHGGPLSPAELERVEAEVNAVIRQNIPTRTEVMTPDAAISAGAVALFGEKYGDTVRVLTLGQALEGEGAYSVELCGGTHVARTGDLALFKIVTEQGVAAGVRRIEALTGEAARRYLLDQAGVAKSLADQFKVPVAEVPARVDAILEDRKRLEKELADVKRKLALGGGGAAPTGPEEIGGVKLVARLLQGIDGKGLRPVIEDFRKEIGSGVIAVVGVSEEGKAAIAVAVTADLTDRFNAAAMVKDAVAAMGGQGGGGKPDFAQGGAPDGSAAEAGLAAVRKALGA
jgi:alanyl-tRNA synthetase